MKIAYIDLNYPDHYESYAINPKRYGGGRIFAAWAKELINNFHIFSSESSFQDLSENDSRLNCHQISHDQQQSIRDGKAIAEVIPETEDVDIFVHHFSNIHINTLKPQIIWCLGYGEQIHPLNKHVMLYNKNKQRPVTTNLDHIIYDVVIGVPIPESFEYNKKEDFIFQCTRHVPEFGSINVAQLCNHYKIKCIFAGPINDHYPLLNHIDNVNTFYIGTISNEEKIEYTKKARLYTFLHSWPTPFNLSAIDALAYGTPIVSTPIGFWPELIEQNKNGFIIENEKDFINVWNKSLDIDQQDCFNTAKNFTVNKMIESFHKSILSCYDSRS
jgi:glycosyltransferase involved in cell wall biosynthesis